MENKHTVIARFLSPYAEGVCREFYCSACWRDCNEFLKRSMRQNHEILRGIERIQHTPGTCELWGTGLESTNCKG